MKKPRLRRGLPVMNQPIYHCCRGHRIPEDRCHFENGKLLEMKTLPRSYSSANSVKQHFHLLAALLDVPEIVDEETVEVSQLLDEPAQSKANTISNQQARGIVTTMTGLAI